MQKFSELPYTRPDIAAAVEEYKRYSEAFKAAKTFEEAKKVFLDAEKLDTHLSTIASLCSIRNTMNGKLIPINFLIFFKCYPISYQKYCQ